MSRIIQVLGAWEFRNMKMRGSWDSGSHNLGTGLQESKEHRSPGIMRYGTVRVLKSPTCDSRKQRSGNMRVQRSWESGNKEV